MQKIPRHIAIIMDGNGRWAQKKFQPRTFGHTAGVERAREVVKECSRLGVEVLTLYTFSTENWQRPSLEVNFLMRLLARYLANESNELLQNNVRVRAIGCLEKLPKEIQIELEKISIASQKNTGLTLNLALSYGAREEICQAARKLVRKAASGQISEQQIDEELFARELYTGDLPDPELLIRTGGDQRISNFLLWQLAYAELYFTDLFWPDFDIQQLHKAVEAFGARERRFGKVMDPQ